MLAIDMIEVFRDTYAIVVLTASASRLGVELAGAASGHLVGDSLNVVVGGRHFVCCGGCEFRKEYWRRFVEKLEQLGDNDLFR